MHYSRVMPGYTADTRYYASTAVFLNEVIKLVFCAVVCIAQQGFRDALDDIFYTDCWKLSIPALLYTLQNTLQYVAVSNLDAATFQVTYQLKILTTAFFAVIILHRDLTKVQWGCLLMLTIGIGLVQMPPEAFNGLVAFVIVSALVQSAKTLPNKAATVTAAATATAAAATTNVIRSVTGTVNQKEDMNSIVGFIAVSVACILSGLASIYFEKVLKNGKKVSVWTRNVQLSMFSLIPAFFLGVIVKDATTIHQNGFFHGYNRVVWAAILLQAIGGILIAFCIKHADNIAKNFATSISILISFLASVYFFNYTVHFNFILGATIVILSTYLYSISTKTNGTKDEEYKSLERT